MGFFSRVSNIITGKANKALDNLENPVEQIEVAILKRKEAIDKAKLESASFIGSVSQKKNEATELKKKIAQYEEGIRSALSNEDEEKAKTFLFKKKELDNQLTSLETTITNLSASAEKVKSSILTLEKEVNELKAKKSELAARYSTAKAQAKVNEILTDVNKDSNVSLTDIEQKIIEAENYAKGLDAFKPQDADAELKEYMTKDATSPDVEDELNKYR
ncbi:MAG: PspA/IM30 family protein [Cellulosilyticaceae bacterium]